MKSLGGFTRLGGNSGLYQSRRYASKSSGDLFEGVLQGGEAVKGGEGKEASVLKPRIPVQREKVEGQKMRSHYKHKNFLESVAHKRRVPTSMKKVWHEARAVRRLPVKKALSFLEVHPTRSSKHLYSAIRQAKLNAVWRGFREEDLEVCTFSRLPPIPTLQSFVFLVLHAPIHLLLTYFPPIPLSPSKNTQFLGFFYIFLIFFPIFSPLPQTCLPNLSFTRHLLF